MLLFFIFPNLKSKLAPSDFVPSQTYNHNYIKKRKHDLENTIKQELKERLDSLISQWMDK